ncbi:MAG: DUF6285 domain-containing protein [Pseudonocardiaceae bacterium]
MQNRPDAPDLIAAVAEWIEDHAVPALSGGTAFHGRVAVNALRIVERELRAGPDHHAADRAALAAFVDEPAGDADLLRRLAERIRSGELDGEFDSVLGALRPLSERKLLIANPRYLPGATPAARSRFAAR